MGQPLEDMARVMSRKFVDPRHYSREEYKVKLKGKREEILATLNEGLAEMTISEILQWSQLGDMMLAALLSVCEKMYKVGGMYALREVTGREFGSFKKLQEILENM